MSIDREKKQEEREIERPGILSPFSFQTFLGQSNAFSRQLIRALKSVRDDDFEFRGIFIFKSNYWQGYEELEELGKHFFLPLMK